MGILTGVVNPSGSYLILSESPSRTMDQVQRFFTCRTASFRNKTSMKGCILITDTLTNSALSQPTRSDSASHIQHSNTRTYLSLRSARSPFYQLRAQLE